MYETQGCLVFGARGRQKVISRTRVAAVSWAAAAIMVDDLLRELSMCEGAETDVQHGLFLSVSVNRCSHVVHDGRLTMQRMEDAKKAEEEIMAAQLREGEFDSRWTINHPQEKTDE